MFDPRELGADCDRCPLRGSIVVPPERSRLAPPLAILVGEAPGESEEKERRPFIGAAGFELQRAMQTVGLRRGDCHITNALLCRPPSNKIDKAEKEATKRNKAFHAANPDATEDRWISPIDACRPRLLNEIRIIGGNRPNVIALGGTAYRSLTSRRDKPMTVRGGPREEAFGRLLPTLHPSFVMRTRRWTHAFVADLARAQRWFTSGLAWKTPETVYRPTTRGLIEWLEREAGSPFVVYDVETAPGFPEFERYDPMHDRLRLIGLSSHDSARAILVRFRSKDDPSRLLYSIDEYREFIRIFREFFASPRWRKGGHNAGYYDRMVIEKHFGVTPEPLIDTIGLHKFTEPELPHDLGYVGSIYSDVGNWKQGHHANENETDREEEDYCATDCAVTALSIRPLAQAVESRNQTRLVRDWFPFLQGLCVDLHKVGMYVDQRKRWEWDAKMLTDAKKFLRTIRDATGLSDFNPGSFPQVGALLFDDWKLMPVDYTESGDPSTNDDSLREILAKQPITDAQRTTIQSIRMYRRRTKYRGTYTLKLRPMTEVAVESMLAFDEEETEDERERRFKKESKRQPGVVLADGRVHGDWNPHGTLGWRLSSSNPNNQNVPVKLRDIFTEEPGWCIVACDAAQLELRMGAALAHSEAYLSAFRDNRDPHLEFCLDIFGDGFRNANKDGQKSFRRFVKELTYSSEYRAEVETVHSVLTSSENDDETLVFPNVTISQVAAMHRKWLARAKFDGWWEATDAKYARQGFLLDPVLGLRCDFLDGPTDPQIGNKLVNFECQSGGAALVHIATRRFFENMPKDWIGRVQPINQGHDALALRVKLDLHAGPQVVKRDPQTNKVIETKWCVDENCGCLPRRVGMFLEECFKIDGREYGLDVMFLGEMKIGNNWKEV